MGFAQEAETAQLDTGDIAWMLTATLLMSLLWVIFGYAVAAGTPFQSPQRHQNARTL